MCKNISVFKCRYIYIYYNGHNVNTVNNKYQVVSRGKEQRIKKSGEKQYIDLYLIEQ